MKKGLLLTLCAVAVATTSSVQALELKTPNVGALKNVTNTAVTTKTSQADAKKAANEEAFKKQFDATIVASNKKLDDAKNLGKTSVWDLAKIILDEETYKSFDERKAEEGINVELAKALNNALKAQIKAKDFNPEVYNANNTKYVTSVKNLQIAQNRCENIMNNMSPTFKKILDGEVSMLNVKSQLVESAKITKNVKSVTMGQSALLRKLNKINSENKIVITIPDNEKVQYNKDGVVGSINYQLDTTNAKVKSSYTNLISAFNLSEDVKKEIAEIENNPNLTKEEKDRLKAQATMKTFTDMAKERAEMQKAGEKVAELTAQQKTAKDTAIVKLTEAVSEYTALGISCTKLGLTISSKPILAAPLALEVDQLKYTAKMLSTSASSMKNTISALKSLK